MTVRSASGGLVQRSGQRYHAAMRTHAPPHSTAFLSASPTSLLASRLRRALQADAIGIFALCVGLGAGFIAQQTGGELTPLRGATLGTVLAGHAGLFLYRARAGFEYATWLALALLFISAGYLLWGRPGLGLGLGCAFALHHGLCAWAFQLHYALLLLRGTPGEATRQIGGVFARRPCRPASGHV